MPVEGRPTRVHGLVAMVYENGGAMVLPNYGMNDPAELDRLPNRAVVDEEGFGFDELLELTSLAQQAGLLEPIVDLEEDRERTEDGEVDVTPITTLYGLTPEGTAVARERAEGARAGTDREALGETLEDAVASAVERGVAGAVEELARADDRPFPARAADEDGDAEDGTGETADGDSADVDGTDRGTDATVAVAHRTGSDLVARALAAFAVALVLVATADATRDLLLGALPQYRTAITAGLLSLYAVVLLFVVRTAYRVGKAAREADDAAATEEEGEDGEEDADDGDDSTDGEDAGEDTGEDGDEQDGDEEDDG